MGLAGSFPCLASFREPSYTIGMCYRIRSFLAIIRTTCVETIQEPASLIVLLAAVGVTSVAPFFHFHTFGEEGRLARDGGLASLLVFGLMLGCAAAGAAVHRECASGTAAATLAKPVGRGVFLTAKYVGILAVCGLFWIAVTAATLAAEAAADRTVQVGEVWDRLPDVRLRQWAVFAPLAALAAAAVLQYRRHARFGVAAFLLVPVALILTVLASGFWSHAGVWGPYTLRLNLQVIPAALPLFFALAWLAAWSAALAVRLPTGAVLLAGVALLGAGLAADTWSTGAAAGSLRGVLAGFLPNIQHYWLADALAHGGTVPWPYIARTAALAAAGCTLALVAGAGLFRTRDIG